MPPHYSTCYLNIYLSYAESTQREVHNLGIQSRQTLTSKLLIAPCA